MLKHEDVHACLEKYDIKNYSTTKSKQIKELVNDLAHYDCVAELLKQMENKIIDDAYLVIAIFASGVCLGLNLAQKGYKLDD